MRKSKSKPQRSTARILDENDQVVEVTEVGVPGLFQPGEWDIQEEVRDMDSFREYQKEMEGVE